MVDENPNKMLRTDEAAEMIGVDRKTLEGWRYRGVGPSFIRLSKRCVKYRMGDMLNFIASKRVAVQGCDNIGTSAA